jgi:ribosomal protein S18 acetylase RimI-like enzyme
MSDSHQIVELGVEEVDRVEPLWKGMVAHHREVVGGEWPVHSEQEAWRRRRQQYVEWLRGEEEGAEAQLLAAVRGEGSDGAVDGYAMLVTRAPGATWELGERVGEIESLAVAEAVRGQGVGTMLMEACRQLLRADGIAYWEVAVVEANSEAAALYERAGFRPFYRTLLGEVD